MNGPGSSTCRIAERHLSTATLSQRLLVIILSLLVTGCAGIRVEHFTEETYAPRRAANQIEWLDQEPAQPHIELARILVRSSNLSDESLRDALVNRAHALGADALIRDVPMTIATAAGSPYFEPGLFGPSGAAFGLYGYGWYTPYTSNPYLLTQGATDQPRIEHAVSAIAIRYQQESGGYSSK